MTWPTYFLHSLSIIRRTPRWIYYCIFTFMVSRLLLEVAGYLAVVTLPSPLSQEYWHLARDNYFLDIWLRWDSGYYLSIAKEGYSYSPDTWSNVAFFPLYPFLIKLFSYPLFSYELSALFVSNACFLLSLMVVYRLAVQRFSSDGVAMRTVLYLSVAPTSFFFMAAYSESVFLLLSSLTFYSVSRGRWLIAGLCGGLLSATRPIGICIVLIMMLFVVRHFLRARSTHVSQYKAPHFGAQFHYAFVPSLAVLLSTSGLIAYMGLLQLQFGRPFLFVDAQSAWARVGQNALRNAVGIIAHQDYLGGLVHANVLYDFLLFFGVFATIIPIMRRIGVEYGLYTLLLIVIPVLSGSVSSMARFILVAFPVFMVLALWGRREVVHHLIIIPSALLLGVLTAVFVTWHWVA